MKDTAVEWIIKILEGQKDHPFNYSEWQIVFEHAKKMELEQLNEAWREGYDLNDNVFN